MATPYFESKGVTLFNASCTIPDTLSPGSVDLIVTSPPYNVGIEYASNNDELPYEDYLKFSEEWIKNCFVWAKDRARFCLNIPIEIMKCGRQCISADLINIAKQVGWKYHHSIVWNKGVVQQRGLWGTFLSAKGAFAAAPVELIIVFYKGDEYKKLTEGKTTISKQDFVNWTNGLWRFNGVPRTEHPAPFPRDIPKRCIALYSYVGDTVLDPFNGSGTTMVEAYHANRPFVGIELDAGYCEVAKKRFLKGKGLFKGEFLS